MMDLNMINIFSYAIVFITIISMVFGVYAYILYKTKEILKKNKKKTTFLKQNNPDEYEKYLFLSIGR